MSELETFSGAAKGLARNPLGIVALFIVLIYGFAALTLGINSSLQAAERFPLVWFLVLFPVIVLGTFGWLVSKHHEKLYAPGDYKTDEGFLQAVRVRALRVRARHTAELQAQRDDLKAKVRETLVASEQSAHLSKEIDALLEKLSAEIDLATTITVDVREFLHDPTALYTYPVAAFETVNNLLDEVYFRLRGSVRPFEYGHSWVLRSKESGKVIRVARMITRTPRGKPLADPRSLSEVGIKPGATLHVEAPHNSS